MTLKDVARYADNVVFTDTYGSATFRGQILLFNDSTRSGPAAKRRILDVAPEVTIPTRRTITDSAGNIYLVSVPSYDYYNGTAIRAKYPIVPSEGVATVRTIGQVLANSGGTTDLHVDFSFLRRVVIEDKSSFEQGFDVYFSRYNTINVGEIIVFGSKYYKARQDSRYDEVGFSAVEVVQIRSPLSTLTFQAKGSTYNASNDNYTPPAAISSVSTFIEYSHFDFEHAALGYTKVEPGDKAISFLKTAVTSVKSGDKIGNYNILNYVDNSTYWTTHARL